MIIKTDEVPIYATTKHCGRVKIEDGWIYFSPTSTSYLDRVLYDETKSLEENLLDAESQVLEDL